MAGIGVTRIEALDLRLGSHHWAFARDRRGDIEAHFNIRRNDRPSLWDGRVLLMYQHLFASDALSGSYFETNFASFMAWRDWGMPDASVSDCFALAALQGSDGAYVTGIMGAQTANAGRVYFPGGTPDPGDVRGTMVDLEASVRREVQEETGLMPSDFAIEAGWHCVTAKPLIALLKPMRARETADSLCRQIREHIAGQTSPELADVMVVRTAADIHPNMPPFMQAFLRHQWP